MGSVDDDSHDDDDDAEYNRECGSRVARLLGSVLALAASGCLLPVAQV